MDLFVNKVIPNEKYNHRKRNLFDLSGEYGKMLLYDGSECLFDKDDYDILSKHYWSINNSRHVCTKIDGKTVSLTTYIYNCYGIKLDNGIIIDHKDRNPLNNTKENFRKCTVSQNGMNKNIQSNNTSGKTGVHFDDRIKRYYAYIKKDGKHYGLGYYQDFVDAVNARVLAEKQYFGEFATSN